MVSYLSVVSKLDKNKRNQNKMGIRDNNSNNNNGNNNNSNNNKYSNKQELSSSNSKSPRSYSDLVCSICKSNRIITDAESGELICSNCGQVISNKVEQEGPEWRNFDLLSSSASSSSQSNNSRSRVGMSTS